MFSNNETNFNFRALLKISFILFLVSWACIMMSFSLGFSEEYVSIDEEGTLSDASMSTSNDEEAILDSQATEDTTNINIDNSKVFNGNNVVSETQLDTSNSTIKVVGTVTPCQSDLNPYACAIGYLSKTNEFYKNIVNVTDSETGKYEITDVPSDFVGVITAGATGHANAGKAVYAQEGVDIPGNFDLIEGVDCSFDDHAGLNNYVLKKGSRVWTTNRVGDTPVEVSIPIDFDISLSDFMPFGLRTHSVFKVNYDYSGHGTITYSHLGDGQGIELTFEAIPKARQYVHRICIVA